MANGYLNTQQIKNVYSSTRGPNSQGPFLRPEMKEILNNMKNLQGLFGSRSIMNNIYKENISQINTGFQKSIAALNERFSAAEGTIQNSFNRGIEALNVNYNKAIQGLNDIAQPFRDTSLMLQTEFKNLLGLGEKTSAQIMSDLEKTPGYQFQFEQGQKAIERSAAAKGNLVSGNTLTELTKFGQGMAQSYFQDRVQNLVQGMNATNPYLAQLEGQLGSLRAGLGQDIMGAEAARAGMLSGVQTTQGQKLAELETQKAGMLGGIMSNQQGLLEQARQADNAALTARMTGQQQADATVSAADIGAQAAQNAAATKVAGEVATANIYTKSQQKIAGLNAGKSGA